MPYGTCSTDYNITAERDLAEAAVRVTNSKTARAQGTRKGRRQVTAFPLCP